MTVLMTYPLVLHLGAAIPGDGFDGWQNYWNLWWVKSAVLDLHQSPYFTTYLYHPIGYSLQFHTLNVFNALLTLPVQLGLGVTISYNFVVLFSFSIGGYGTYLLALHVLGARESVSDHLIAFLAGVIFTFSPFHFAHLLGHMQVISLEWLPFYALVLVKALESQRLRLSLRVLLPTVFLVLAGLCDWYFILYLLIFTAIFLGYRMVSQRQVAEPLLITGLIVLLSAVLLSPLLVPIVVEALRSPSCLLSPFRTTARLSADLLAFVVPNEFHPLWGRAATRLSQAFTSSTSERMVFAGYIPLALAGYALWRRRRATRFWLIGGLVFFVLSLGPYLHVGGRQLPVPLPYLALYRLPLCIDIARSVSRFDVMVMLSVAIVAALGLQRLLVSFPESRRRVLAVAAIALVCFEFLPVPYPLSEVWVPSFYQALARDNERYAILELPMNRDRPAHLLYQTVHRKPIISGYVTRPNPLSLVEKVPMLQQFRFLGPDIIAQEPHKIAPEVFQYLGIRYVILHQYMLPPGRERETVFRLVDEVFADQVPYYQDGQITVYRTGDAEPESLFLVLGPEWGKRRDWHGEPGRRPGSEATCTVIAPSAGKTRLAFTAFSTQGTRSLQLSINDASVGRYQIVRQATQFVAGDLWLQEGANVLRLRDESRGDPAIVFTSLDLRGD